jgi:parallel beta-helix repeat protein
MKEIRTQADMNNINATITACAAIGETIKIYPLPNNAAYNISSQIVVGKNNIVIQGVGMPKLKSTIASTDASYGSMILIVGNLGTELSDITIRNLTLIGNKALVGGASGIYANFCGKAYASGLTTGVTRYSATTVGYTYIIKNGITIEDCIMQDHMAHGIYLLNSSNCILSGNLIKNSSAGINLFQSNTNIIVDNTIEYGTTCGIFLFTSSIDNIISGNTCQNCAQEGIKIATNSSKNIITNNTIQNIDNDGLYLTSTCECNTIVNNTIQNNKYQGINISSVCANTVMYSNMCVNNAYSGINVNGANTNVIASNICTVNNQNGIQIISSVGAVVSGNICQNNTTTGILANNVATYIEVFGNTSIGNGTQYNVSGTGSDNMSTYNV